MNKRTASKTLTACVALVIGMLAAAAQAAASRPNILWLSCEDISPHIGCFGDPYAKTPRIDQLATEGVRYVNTFTAAGVCAPCRSGIITGMYHTTLGTHHMRSSAKLPDTIKAFTTYLRQAGYYCSNNRKTDYQTKDLKDAWDESSGKAHWRQRSTDQPFFAVFNFGGCHESGIARESKYRTVTQEFRPDQRQDPDKLHLPPYYPDTPIVREDWKRNYELITAMDAWAGDLMDQLRADGLYEETIIFFWSDHGVGLPRAKRWLYDSGTHVPLVVRIPAQYRMHGQGTPNAIDDRLVSSIDFAPTVLRLASLSIPSHMQGRPFLGDGLPAPRDYVFGARDRMDERYDIIRAVRDKRYRYIRNYEPQKTYYQYMNTPEKGATMREIRRVAAAGNLPPAARLFMANEKPVEELYDLRQDPHEINNLAADPAYRQHLERLRRVHRQWMVDTRDLGLIPEPEIIAREKALGNRYAIMRQGRGAAEFNQRLVEIATLASSGVSALDKLVQAMQDEDAAIRYWGATGIGNIGQDAESARELMTAALQDPAVCVRVAAARALCLMNRPRKAIPVLEEAMRSEYQWGRLAAVIVLDSIGEMARPAEPTLRKALAGQPNKYITRVANHTLNVLNGTDNEVK